jgi:hypothetical protein
MSNRPEDPAEQDAKRFFENCGLTVRRIPEASKATPDFEVDGDGPGFLVEVKARRDDEEFRNLPTGKIFSRTASSQFSKKVSWKIQQAAKQFEAYDSHRCRWQVVWLSAEDIVGDDATMEMFHGTLYGIADVADLDRLSSIDAVKSCYYLHRGAFERFPAVDAAILAHQGYRILCLNEFSERCQALAGSVLAQLFGNRPGVDGLKS